MRSGKLTTVGIIVSAAASVNLKVMSFMANIVQNGPRVPLFLDVKYIANEAHAKYVERVLSFGCSERA